MAIAASTALPPARRMPNPAAVAEVVRGDHRGVAAAGKERGHQRSIVIVAPSLAAGAGVAPIDEAPARPCSLRDEWIRPPPRPNQAAPQPDHQARSLIAVLFGTFTLRLSTGLTGALLTYHLAHFERVGGVRGRARA